MSEKIYCGSGKEFGNFGSVNLSICLSDLPKEFITESKNGKKYINIVLNKKKQVDQYGKTHSLEVNTYKPEPKTDPWG